MDMTIDVSIKRVDPRRPFTLNVDGLKRIELGQIGGSGIDFSAPDHGQAQQKFKPVRLPTDVVTTRCLLAIAHGDRGTLDDLARQVVAAAALLADEVTEVVLLVFGELTEDAATLGADRYIVLPQYGHHLFAPEAELAIVIALLDELRPDHVFLSDNGGRDSDLGRRLGAALSTVSLATNVVEINHAGQAVYWQQGSLIARRSLSKIILLESDVVDARLPFLGRGNQAEQLALVLSDVGRTATLTSAFVDMGVKTMAASQMELEEADFIVSAGNGVGDVALFNSLANALDAAVGASRVAVDDGKFTREKQIGATGKTVSASTYLAFGISGAVQHLQGIKDCRHVIAVNLDASAPMIKRADLSIIGDTQELMEALLKQVRQARTAELAA